MADRLFLKHWNTDHELKFMVMNTTAAYWIDQLGLQAHPEGGYFYESYRSSETIEQKHLPERYGGDRHYASAIYFLLQEYDFSAFHKLLSDEIWHYYAGDALNIYLFNRNNQLETYTLGKNLNKGEKMQILIPHGHWFAAEVTEKTGYCLAGCTTSPAFEYEDLEIGHRKQLISMFPEYAKLIERLTYQ